ncbi:MAG: hypothetical protein ACYC96_09355 [Fimbriimonadaceae bacterium]
MIAWMFAQLVSGDLTVLQSQPPITEVAAGRRIYHSGAGIDRTLQNGRLTLGTWFDGRIRRAVDTVTWVRPALVARWFGYMAERDGWSDAAVRQRWDVARRSLGTNLTFIVRLSAFPRLDPFEYGIGAPPRPETLKGVRFRLTFSPPEAWKPRVILSSGGACTAQFEKESQADVTGRPFYSLTPLASLFMDQGETDRPDDGIRLGDYYGAVYVVSFPATGDMLAAPGFELTVLLPSKREHATFVGSEPTPAKPMKVGDDD